jgi:hypothetical protein
MFRKKTYELIEEINSYDFFSKVGAPVEGDLKKVHSLGDAVQRATENKWDAMRWAFWNRLNVFQRNIKISEDRDWNKKQCTEAVKLIEPAKLKISQFFAQNNLWDALAGDVWVQLCGAVHETEIDDLVPPLFFKPLLLPIYKDGRYACGWDGKGVRALKEKQGYIDSLPLGRLIVY